MSHRLPVPHADELAALADHDDAAVRRRARLVRVALAEGPTLAANALGVSRRTASTWLRRYRTDGAAALRLPAERSRNTDAARRAVLTAPLWMPTSKWSSRSVAERVGVSQSFVARTWHDAQSGAQNIPELRDLVDRCRPTLLGVLVTRERAVLVLALTPTRAGPQQAHASRRTQRAVRTLLAADLVRPGITDRPDPAVEEEFWAHAATAAGGTRLLALASCATKAPLPVAVGRECASPAEWQALLRFFARCVESHVRGPALELEAELRVWHRDDRRHAFAWIARAGGSAVVSTRPAPGQPLRRHRGLADEIVSVIRRHVVEGKLAGGDRVTESFLAGRLRTSRAQVRSALRRLEQDGLLTVTSGRAAVVPIMTPADVIETYAARRALGAIMVRAAVRWRPEGRLAVLRTLEALEASLAENDVEAANQGDLDFQNTLAEASGLVRIGPMLRLLAEQLRMFVAVMGLGYAYPAELIVDQDRAIFTAIDSGNGDLAVERWRAKLDEAQIYMFDRMAEADHLR